MPAHVRIEPKGKLPHTFTAKCHTRGLQLPGRVPTALHAASGPSTTSLCWMCYSAPRLTGLGARLPGGMHEGVHTCGSQEPALSRCTTWAATRHPAPMGQHKRPAAQRHKRAQQLRSQAPTGSACACAPQFCSLNTYARDSCAAGCAPAGGSSAPLGPPLAANSRTPSPDNASVRANAAPLRHRTAVGGRRGSAKGDCDSTASITWPSHGCCFPSHALGMQRCCHKECSTRHVIVTMGHATGSCSMGEKK